PHFQNSGLSAQRPGRTILPLAFGACAPDFQCNPCAGPAPQLRQFYCPNSDHAKFFSITQARQSRPSVAPHTGICATAPRSGQRTAEFPDEIVNRADRQKLLWNQGFDRSEAMKLFTIISAGLVLAAASAQAQSPSPGPHYSAT